MHHTITSHPALEPLRIQGYNRPMLVIGARLSGAVSLLLAAAASVCPLLSGPTALGQVATNAHDEALYLLLRTLDLPLDSDARVLTKRLNATERGAIEAVLRRRALEHVPAAYLTREAWLGGDRFYVDERVIIPRSYFVEIIASQLDSWLRAP